MKRKQRGGKSSKMIILMRSAKKKKLKHETILTFSIEKIIFPKNYVECYEEYKNIVRTCPNYEEHEISACATTTSILKGRAKIQFKARILDGHNKELYRKTIRTTGKDTFIPFIEPYFVYRALVRHVIDNKFVHFEIEKLEDIILFPLRMSKYFGLEFKIFTYIFMKDLGMKKYAAEALTKKFPKKKIISIENFQGALHGNKHKEAIKESLYFTYKNALELISKYEVLKFNIMKLVTLMNYKKLSELETILEETPWMMCLPTVQQKFCVKRFSINKFSKFENIFFSEHRKMFPEEYWFAMYIYDAITNPSGDNADQIYQTLESVFKHIMSNCIDSLESNCVVDYFKEMTSSNFSQPPNTPEEIAEEINSYKSFLDGMNVLSESGSIHVTCNPVIYESNKLIHQFIEYFESELDKEDFDNFEDFYDYGELIEEILRTDDNIVNLIMEKNQTEIQPDSRLYYGKYWTLQKNLIYSILRTMILNFGFTGTLEFPEYAKTEDLKRLNKLQKIGHKLVIDPNKPITFVGGLPGTGKTEVISTLCTAFKNQEYENYLILATNGVSTDVLRDRLKKITSGNIMTIDKFTYSAMFDRCEYTHSNTVIIDENQTVDLERLSRCLGHLKGLTHIRFFGDFNQIRPIMVGDVTKELFKVFKRNCFVKLVENNRVKKNPNSSSIVKNFTAVANSRLLDTSYKLHSDDDGTVFVTDTENNISKKILEIYKKEDFSKIEMYTPMNESVKHMNAKMGRNIQRIVLGKTGWKRPNFEVPRFIAQKVSIGCKFRISKNYRKIDISIDKKDKKYITSSELSNGETGWAMKIEKIKIKKDNVFIVHGLMRGGKLKKFVVGDRHVDVRHIRPGYFTTVDALLGGENDIIVFYIHSPLRNFKWFTRDRSVTALSRSKKRIYIMSSFVKLQAREFENIYYWRLRRCGLKLSDEQRNKIRQEETYTMNCEQVLKVLSDANPKKMRNDLHVYIKVFSSMFSNKSKRGFIKKIKGNQKESDNKYDYFDFEKYKYKPNANNNSNDSYFEDEEEGGELEESY